MLPGPGQTYLLPNIRRNASPYSPNRSRRQKQRHRPDTRRNNSTNPIPLLNPTLQ